MDTIKSHKDLIVWQKSIALASTVYAVTRKLPSDEAFGLTRQLRRAAVSIPSNIAEGSARRNRGEYTHFLHIARGSLCEVETQMMIAIDQGYVSHDASAMTDIAEVGRLLNGLIRSLANSERAAHAKACRPTGKREPSEQLTANR